jgi:hypothetical protein
LSVLGVFFAEDTSNVCVTIHQATDIFQSEFLPRDQSEEWRGWMQLVIRIVY